MIKIPTTKALAEVLVANEGADPESAELAAGMILDAVTFRTPEGFTYQSIRDLVENHKSAMPSFYITKPPVTQDTAADAPEPSPLRPLTLTERIAAEHRKAAVATDGPNPWSKATLNITRQVAIEAKDPERAAQLKANAR